jgi:hypothetical protein
MITREDIQKAVSELSPDELSRFRAWFKHFEETRVEPGQEETTATRLGRVAGKMVAEWRKGRTPEK